MPRWTYEDNDETTDSLQNELLASVYGGAQEPCGSEDHAISDSDSSFW
jgi:hypothetical protein